MISNEQRAHDLAVSITQTLAGGDKKDLVELPSVYAGIYNLFLAELDKKYPNGFPSKAEDFNSVTKNKIEELIKKSSH